MGVLTGAAPQTGTDLWVGTMTGEQKPWVFLKTPFNEEYGQWQISTDGGIEPRWSPDGRELYYLDPQGQMMAVSITVTGTTVAPGAPVPLFATNIFGGGVNVQQGFEYDVAGDGRFLINTLLDENRSTEPITLILNWNPGVT